MKSKYSYFDQLCALNYLTLVANHPSALRYGNAVKRSVNTINNR